MARKKKIPNKDDYKAPRALTEVPDSASESGSSPSRGISKRPRLANDHQSSDLPNEDYNDVDRDEEICDRPKRRRTFTEADTRQEDIATAARTRHRHSLPSVDSNSLRRSNRGSVMKNGPRAYSNRWHPIDDSKTSKGGRKKASEGRVKSPSPNDSKKLIPLLPEASNDRNTTPVYHEKDTSYPPRRRSSRNAYNADVAMKYDMSSHWSYRKLKQPQAFAKKLEEKRRSLASTIPREKAPELKSGSPPPVDLPKSIESQGKTRNGRSEDSFEASTGDDVPSGSLNSDRKLVGECRNTPLPPETLPEALSPGAETPIGLYEDLVLPEHDFSVPPSSALPKTLAIEKLPDKQSSRPLPMRKSPKTKPQPRDWDVLTEVERRLYSLQEGAPTRGRTLPRQWATVKQILIEEGFEDIRDEVESLKYWYEDIRLSIEAFFQAEPEPLDSKDWIFWRVEGFDVYKKRKGRNYWKKSGEKTVKLVETQTEYQLPDLQPSVALTDQEMQDESANFQLDEPDAADSNWNRDVSATDTQVDKFLALAEPCEEADSLLPLSNSGRDFASSKIVRNELEHLPDTVGDDQTMHDQSEKSLMDIMRTEQPASFHAPPSVSMAEMDAMLAEAQSSQEIYSRPLPRPSQHANRTASPTKRRGKNAGEETFAIFEDETGETNAGGKDRDDVRPLDGRRERDLDLPVENMNAGELVPGSQERAASLTPRRIRYQLADISRGGPYIPPIWVDGGEHASIFGGPHL